MTCWKLDIWVDNTIAENQILPTSEFSGILLLILIISWFYTAKSCICDKIIIQWKCKIFWACAFARRLWSLSTFSSSLNCFWLSYTLKCGLSKVQKKVNVELEVGPLCEAPQRSLTLGLAAMGKVQNQGCQHLCDQKQEWTILTQILDIWKTVVLSSLALQNWCGLLWQHLQYQASRAWAGSEELLLSKSGRWPI